jgi:uncharacterized membrane protein YedE/YeeE
MLRAMHNFTPGHAVVGGVLIGLGLAVVLIGTGRIPGLSGITAGIVRISSADRSWRVSFLVGALAIGAVFELAAPDTFDRGPAHPLWLIAISGALVGYGTRLGNGCTSGHGLCGLGRFSKRSLIATCTFFGVGVVTATIAGSFS